jgi:hypothetical protein
MIPLEGVGAIVWDDRADFAQFSSSVNSIKSKTPFQLWIFTYHVVRKSLGLGLPRVGRGLGCRSPERRPLHAGKVGDSLKATSVGMEYDTGSARCKISTLFVASSTHSYYFLQR